ncbi:hypothetical protein [Variovorax boronicumulans]|uniref:hypothetical protein n=1 Tax=Variovorax boronicumulans TaxID=436515 RepID=UPI0033918D51
MSNDRTTGLNGADGDGELRDPLLRRALDHAPDHDARPDPRTRDAILKMARNLAPAPVSPAAANNASAAPWWRRLFGGGDTRSRMPWNAAFATVLVASFVAVLWHREPIPDAQLDGEARVGGATVQAPPPASSAAPTPPSAAPVPQAPSPATVAPQAPASPASPPAEPPAGLARDSAREAPAEQRAADAVRRSAPPLSAAPQTAPAAAPAAAPSPEIEAKPAQLPAGAVAPAPAPAPPAPITAAPDAAEQSAARARKSSESQWAAREKRSNEAAGAPAPSAAAPSAVERDRSPPALAAAPPPAAIAAPAPPRRELADSPSAFAGQGQANAEASGGLRPTPAPRAAAAAKAVGPQAGMTSFAALDRWTAFDFTRAGLGVRHARGDIEGLAALVNTVARSATEPDAPLAAPVEARLSFYEGGTLIAELQIAGDQVRWTPQPGGAASVGTPPAQALAAMRALLTR